MPDYFIHPQAICDSKNVGAGTRIWAFVHVFEGVVIGSDVNICPHTIIEDDVVVGDRVTIKGGVQLWDGVRIEDDVFIGPNVTFTNDPFPRSKLHPEEFSRTLVQKGASIGANATLLRRNATSWSSTFRAPRSAANTRIAPATSSSSACGGAYP